jgi:cell division protein FtsQ
MMRAGPASYTKRPVIRREGIVSSGRRLAVGNGFFRVSLAILSVSLLLWAWQQIYDPRLLPVSHVNITGDFSRVSRTRLQQDITPFLQSGWLRLPVKRLQTHLEKWPWIARAHVQRRFPNTLMISFKTRRPVAQVKSDVEGKTALLDSTAQIFYLDKVDITGLPLFISQVHQYTPILDFYQAVKTQLASQGLSIQTLTWFPKQRCQIQLKNGLRIILEPLRPLVELQRFLTIYATMIAPKLPRIDRVDLRYAHGMAVHFKPKRAVSLYA